jgi:hypothetical protein
MNSKLIVSFVASCLLGVGCSPAADIAKVPDAADAAAPPTSCTTTAECGTGYTCDLPTTKCGAGQGQCVPVASTCTTDGDCATGMVCAFAVSDACAAQGKCVQPSQGCFCASDSCACDGTTVQVGCAAQLPSGYAPKPIAHDGACAPADDGGACPATTPAQYSSCTTEGQSCSYAPNTTCTCGFDPSKQLIWTCVF